MAEAKTKVCKKKCPHQKFEVGDKINRYILEAQGKTTLVCIGVNPSTANKGICDNTIRTVCNRALYNEYDSWVMINLYPQRATKPKCIHKINAYNQKIVDENLIHIKSILEKYENVEIWAAWGTLITKRPFLKDCLKSIYELSKNYNCKWITFGKRSKAGHPHHPLYLRNDEMLQEFDIKEYIRKL